MNITRQSLLLLWGLTVTGAYLLTEYLGHTLEHGHSAVLWTWAGMMTMPLVVSLLLGHRANALVWVWAGATVLAMVENFGVHILEAKPLMHFSYHTLWFFFGAAGFAYTAAMVEGSARKKLYAGAMLLNLLGAALLLVAPSLLKGYQYVVLAFVQGVPMLLDVPLRRQHEQQVAQ